MRLPVDERGRSKGFGYVEFADREGLYAAITKRDTTFNNRPIKITLDEPKQGGGGGYGAGRTGGDRNQQDGPLKSDEADWRRPSEPESAAAPVESSWQQSGGGRDRDRDRDSHRGGYMPRNTQGGGGGYGQNKPYGGERSQ